MAKIMDYELRNSEEKGEFFVLILQGGVEIVKSESGNMYATARKASMPCTFNEATCKMLIGEEIEGEVKKVACEEYQYTIPETGQKITLSHRYEFIPHNFSTNHKNVEKASTPKPIEEEPPFSDDLERIAKEVNQRSMNGVH